MATTITSREIEQRVINAVRRCLTPAQALQPIELAYKLQDGLGINSIGLIKLSLLLEKDLQLVLAEHTNALVKAITVQNLIDLMCELTQANTTH